MGSELDKLRKQLSGREYKKVALPIQLPPAPHSRGVGDDVDYQEKSVGVNCHIML